jgi:hypothetical protein
MFDQAKSDEIAEYMTILLTSLCGQICVYRPIDVCSVWHPPIKRGGRWIYRAKATQHNALLDTASLKDYEVLINRRAADIFAPIRVTSVMPQGMFFVYEVTEVGY